MRPHGTNRTRLIVTATATALLLGAVVATAHPAAVFAADEARPTSEPGPAKAGTAPATAHPAKDEPQTHRLKVYVRERTDWGLEAVDGALVTVFQLGCPENTACPLAEKAHAYTNNNGIARFRLPGGDYGVHATDGDDAGSAKVHLDRDRRVRVVLDEDEPGPEPPKTHALGIAASLCRASFCRPAADAHVTVWPLLDDGPRIQKTDRGVDGLVVIVDPVTAGATDDHGLFAVLLPEGAYRIIVSTGDASAEAIVKLGGDSWTRLVLQGPQDGDKPLPAYAPTLEARPTEAPTGAEPEKAPTAAAHDASGG